MANHFWAKWQNEYLTELRDMHKTVSSQKKHSSRLHPEVGEVVLVQQDAPVPRSNWPLGRILELIKGSDSLVRTAKILASSGNTCLRPISKLIPLEIRGSKISNERNKKDNDVERTAQPPRRVPLP